MNSAYFGNTVNRYTGVPNFMLKMTYFLASKLLNSDPKDVIMSCIIVSTFMRL